MTFDRIWVATFRAILSATLPIEVAAVGLAHTSVRVEVVGIEDMGMTVPRTPMAVPVGVRLGHRAVVMVPLDRP
ncbi:MAG: hypothetical protein ACLGJC_27210 [Alphaproteobacteria bacterium]